MKIVNHKIVEFVNPDDLQELRELVKMDKPEGLYTITLSATVFANVVKNEEILLSQYAGQEDEWLRIKEERVRSNK